MKVWIVGVNGLLGSSLARALPESFGTTKAQADVTNRNSLENFVKKNREITHIINASAFSLVDLAEEKKEEAHFVNALGPENLGHIAKAIGSKLIHISTDYVFRGDVPRLLHEEDPLGPVNQYGKTKLEGELRLLNVFPEACIIRTSSLFGNGGRNFVAKMFSLLNEKEEIFLSNDQVNSPTYVEDLTDAILQMRDTAGTYHFSNYGMATKYRFGSEIYHIAKNKGLKIKTKKIIPVESSWFTGYCPRPLFSAFDLTKIERMIKRPRNWEDALTDFLEGNV